MLCSCSEHFKGKKKRMLKGYGAWKPSLSVTPMLLLESQLTHEIKGKK